MSVHLSVNPTQQTQVTAEKKLSLRSLYVVLVCFVCALLTACPSYPWRDGAAQFYIAGRLALSMAADPSIPNSKPESWSAHFELDGNPLEGRLRLSTPVGTTVAQVEWAPDHATVQTDKEMLTFRNLDELTSSYFNQTVPVAALFDWLAGKQTQQDVPGWDVNLSAANEGIIKAERSDLAPQVKLRAKVEIYEDNTNKEKTPSL